jgi:hypothetical protein
MSSGTGPSFQAVERAPRISHSGQIQSSLATAWGRRAPEGPGGGVNMSGGQTRTQPGWNPRSQESHTIVPPRISGWPQDAQGRGGCPQPAWPGNGASGGIDSPESGSNPARKLPVAPKGAVLEPGNGWNRDAISSASRSPCSCWPTEAGAVGRGDTGGVGCGGGGAGTGGVASRGGDGASPGGLSYGGGEGASLRSMTRCGERTMGEWGVRIALTPGLRAWP